MTLEQVMHNYFWHIFFITACGFYLGFKVGQWWERAKDEDVPPDNGIWW